MKLRVVFLFLLILALFAGVNANAQSGAAKGKGRVKGKVVDTEGNPLADVTVHWASERLQTQFDLKSNEKGEWVAAGVAGGAWNVDFIKEGYKERRISTQVSELGYNKPVDLPMEKKVPVAAAAPKEKKPGLDLVEAANALRDSKDYDGAIAKYKEALAANAELFAVWGDIARIYSDQGKTDLAIEAYNQFLAKDPTNTEAHIEFANLLLANGKAEDAKKQLEGVDLSGITNPYTIYNLGVGLYNAKMPNDAIKYWEKAVALDPKMTDAWLQLGFAYYSINNAAKAKESFQKVIEIEPGSENAKSAQEMLDNMK